jgi:Holliday junction DNA helicase RuvA
MMFNSLSGEITGKEGSRVFISTGGVEWELEAGSNTLGRIGSIGSTVRIFVYLHHREDAMKLYGFSSEKERFLFLDLLRVSGIGAKQALRILSGMETDRFIASLESGDIDALSSIPGLGKKTAQKIVLALKGKLNFGEEEPGEKHDDLEDALAEMGFDRTSAKNILKEIRSSRDIQDISEDRREQEIFKRAIVRLS